MIHIKQLMRNVGVMVLICVGMFLANVFLYMCFLGGGYHQLFERFIAGCWFFLRDNLPAMSFDAGTWGPGLGAFLLATILAHRFLKAWAARTHRYWSFITSFCLALILPVLFVISFMVPGVLVQWEMLRQVVWLEVR